jgi:hypothetical protein
MATASPLIRAKPGRPSDGLLRHGEAGQGAADWPRAHRGVRLNREGSAADHYSRRAAVDLLDLFGPRPDACRPSAAETVRWLRLVDRGPMTPMPYEVQELELKESSENRVGASRAGHPI